MDRKKTLLRSTPKPRGKNTVNSVPLNSWNQTVYQGTSIKSEKPVFAMPTINGDSHSTSECKEAKKTQTLKLSFDPKKLEAKKRTG